MRRSNAPARSRLYLPQRAAFSAAASRDVLGRTEAAGTKDVMRSFHVHGYDTGAAAAEAASGASAPSFLTRGRPGSNGGMAGTGEWTLGSELGAQALSATAPARGSHGAARQPKHGRGGHDSALSELHAAPGYVVV